MISLSLSPTCTVREFVNARAKSDAKLVLDVNFEDLKLVAARSGKVDTCMEVKSKV